MVMDQQGDTILHSAPLSVGEQALPELSNDKSLEVNPVKLVMPL